MRNLTLFVLALAPLVTGAACSSPTAPRSEVHRAEPTMAALRIACTPQRDTADDVSNLVPDVLVQAGIPVGLGYGFGPAASAPPEGDAGRSVNGTGAG